MKTSVSLYDFRTAFRNYGRGDQFSYNGLSALYEFMEEYEEASGEEMELDVIALCCDFSEYTIGEALEYYGLETINELEDRTLVIYVDDPPSGRFPSREDYEDITIIIQNY